MMYENKRVLEEKASSLFQPDPALVHQYLQTVRPRTLLQAEKRLMLAVLEDAVTCCDKYAHAKRRKEQRIFAETVEWLLTRDTDWAFSFENICETLGMDPDYVRQGLL